LRSDGEETKADAGREPDADGGALPLRSRLGDRYEIVDFLGRGGMGAVYLALDGVLGGKSVALKVVRRELTDEDVLARLRREVVIAQQVTHRNVCRIYDLEQQGGRWVIKMEAVSGETLFDRIARGPLPIDDAVAIARQIGLGLGAAHEQGVIHRDLKPGNVMVEAATGRVVLMDFGIARSAGEGANDDRSGTPAFMAPEQLDGRAVDARADVYSLGWVILHMLSGRAPAGGTFTTATQATAALATSRKPGDAPPDPRVLRPEVPAWLAELVMEMLALDPAARPADGKAVAARLGASDAPALGASSASMSAVAVPAPSRRWPWIVAGASVVAVAGGVAFALARRHDAAPPWHAAIREMEPAYDENIETPVFSPDGTRLAYASDREHTNHLRLRVLDLATGAERTLTGPDQNPLGLSWSKDGRELYFSDIGADMATFRVAVSGGEPRAIDRGYAAACGDDMLLFQFGSPGCPTCPRFVLRDPAAADATGDREVMRLDPSAFVVSYRCDRAGKRVVWSRAEQGAPFYQPSDLWIADVAEGVPRQLTHDAKRNSYPTFAADGRSVVFSSARGGGPLNLWEISVDGGEPVQLTFGNGNDVLADVAGDGERAVFDVDMTSAPLFSYRETGRRVRLTPSRVILIDPQVTPDGAAVVATDFWPLVSRVVVVGIGDGEVRVLGPGVTAAVRPSGDEVVIASAGVPAAVSVVPLAGGAARRIATLDGRVRKLRAGPDGVVHAMIDRGEVREAWRITADGRAEREAPAPWCFVHPAPLGGWTVWLRCVDGAPIEGVAAAPGTPQPAVDAAGFRMQSQFFTGGEFDATGTAYYAYDQPQVVRIDLATGAKTTPYSVAAYGMTVAPDDTIYLTEAVGAARRNLITNFASRPRP
jgi:dipeptidyl aminopeptidase/acylaminoacyl peptidase